MSMEFKEAKMRRNDVELGQIDPSFSPPSKELIMVDEKKRELWMYSISLYRAALQGDWQTAKQIQREHPNCLLEKISRFGDNSLHIASAARRTYFVQQALLYAPISGDQLENENTVGNTAYHLAAASGALEILLEMERKNSKLPYLQGYNDCKPIHMAANGGHRDVILYLLPTCFPHLSRDERVILLNSTINTELYDIALEIFDMDPTLAIARNGYGETPLHILARKPRKQPRGFLRSTSICFSSIFGDEYVRVKLIERMWEQVIKQSVTTISDILLTPLPRLLFSAIEMGNYEFISIIVQGYPDVIWEIDEVRRTIFHAAVKFRQDRIFGHIFDLDGIGHMLADQKELVTGNNLLHLAATLPPEDKLELVPGPAVQLQRELLWFQVVGEFVSPDLINMKNNSGDTPQTLFIKQHRQLRNQAEKWMRKTAFSSIVLATVITFLALQAILHIPNTNPKPNTTSQSSSPSSSSLVLQLFAASILSSITSVFAFTAILSSRFATEDFLVSLPMKLMVGILLQLVSVGTGLSGCSVVVAGSFADQNGWFLMVVLAWVGYILYVQQYVPVIVNVCYSVFGYRYLFWARCPWF